MEERLDKQEKLHVSVMSFNTWNSGNNVNDGLSKIARHIKLHNPDIVGLQEMYEDKIDDLLRLLDDKYGKCSKKSFSSYIISRWPILEEYEPSKEVTNTGCKIQLNAKTIVDVWNVHLHWTTYGPYAARDNNPSEAKSDVLLNCECKNHDPSTSRVHNFESMLKHQPFKESLSRMDKCPMLLLGDFNCPSHYDWTDSCKCFHNDWSFDWPVSKMVEGVGLKDSFREVNGEAALSRGITWSPVVKMSNSNQIEPEDRIDFVYYGGENIQATKSITYPALTENIAWYPNHSNNDWPSDHCAVLTNFEIKLNA